MKKGKIITIGSITWDIITLVKKKSSVSIDNNSLTIPLGDKIRVNNFVYSSGGCAANVAVGLSRLGFDSIAIGVVGDDYYRDFIVSNLAENKVNTDYLLSIKNKPSSLSVILNISTGERTVFHHRAIDKKLSEIDLKKLPKASVLYCGHLYPPADNLLQQIKEWKGISGGKFVWNPGKTQFEQGFASFDYLYPEVDVLIINTEEAESFVGKKTTFTITKKSKNLLILGAKKDEISVKNVEKLAIKFLSKGVKKVIITDGPRGAQGFDGKKHCIVLPKNAKKIDSLGAGDAFASGVVASMIQGEDFITQLHWGNENATSVIQHYGAQEGLLYKIK